MVYWKVILYQCLFFIISFPTWSFANGNNDTSVTIDESKRTIGGRIVNGTKVSLGKFPYIVSLRRAQYMNLFCGGSMIRDKWVLTAGHCMIHNDRLIPASSIVVVGGDLKLYPMSFRRQISRVKKRIVHPTFSEEYLQDDIALLLLETPFKVDSYLKLTHWESSLPPPGTKCVTAGWGYLSEETPETSNELLSVELPILRQRVCKELLGDLITITPRIFCAGFKEGGKDACQGDSGGPFECNGLLAGIVSGGLGCGRPNRPGFYTRVTYYTDWINKVIEANGTCRINLNYFNMILFVTVLYIFSSSLFI